MKIYNQIFIFNNTMTALELGDEIVIGTDINNSISFPKNDIPNDIMKALGNINGVNSVKEIMKNIKKEHQEFFIDILNQLVAYNIIENKEDLTSKAQEDYEKYDRQIKYFKSLLGNLNNAIKIQKTISKSKISIVGLGGIGSYVFYALSAMGIGYIRSYDFDTVELSNLSRQILYNHTDLGKLKIDAAKEKSESISPTTEYVFINKQIITEADAEYCFQNVDLVILCADNPRPDLSLLMNKVAYKKQIPIIFGGSAGSSNIIGPLCLPNITPCFKCIHNLKETTSNIAFVNSIKNNYINTLIDPFNATTGSLMALEAIKFLTNYTESTIKGKAIIIDFLNYEQHTATALKDTFCELCAKNK